MSIELKRGRRDKKRKKKRRKKRILADIIKHAAPGGRHGYTVGLWDALRYWGMRKVMKGENVHPCLSVTTA